MQTQIDKNSLIASEFDATSPSVAPPPDEGGLVSGKQIAEMLHDAAVDLVGVLFGLTDLAALSAADVRPVLRSVAATFETPLMPGIPILSGATLASLSARSFHLATGIWTADDGRLVAHGTAGFAVINTQTRKTVAVPDDVVHALRSLRPSIFEPAH